MQPSRFSSGTHRSIRTTGTLLALCACAIAVPGELAARAQELGFAPEFGYHESVDADGMAQSAGAAVRWRFSSFLGIEGSINYREETYGDRAVTARSWPVMVTGLVYPLPMVYGSCGAGWYDIAIEYVRGAPRADGQSTDLGWQAGAGFEVPLGEAASLIGDFRYMFLENQFEDAPELAEISMESYFVTIGFLIALFPPETATAD